MSPAKLSRREARMAMLAVAVAELEDRGICWDAWAREYGLPRQAVINVRKGDRPCWTGESRKAADLILADARRAAVPNESETCREAVGSGNATLGDARRAIEGGVDKWTFAEAIHWLTYPVEVDDFSFEIKLPDSATPGWIRYLWSREKQKELSDMPVEQATNAVWALIAWIGARAPGEDIDAAGLEAIARYAHVEGVGSMLPEEDPA